MQALNLFFQRKYTNLCHRPIVPPTAHRHPIPLRHDLSHTITLTPQLQRKRPHELINHPYSPIHVNGDEICALDLDGGDGRVVRGDLVHGFETHVWGRGKR
jgi:hypothetical protein